MHNIKKEELKNHVLEKEEILNDEQIEQVSGGTVLEPSPDTPIIVGGVGDMKKDPAWLQSLYRQILDMQ